jgi:murein DD-endopeptidase MepM/ murein hydrolase activator NlpD
VHDNGARTAVVAQDLGHDQGQQTHGQTATLTRTDPGTALADRIRSQAAHQRAGAEDAARRQAAGAAAAKQARADQAAAEAAHAAAQAAQAAEAVHAVRTAAAQTAAAHTARLSPGPLVAPVAGSTVGTAFGQSTDSYWAHLHTGQDFAAPTGATVVAVGNGSITSAGWAGAYGYRVVQTLTDGTELWYCHLSAVGVGAGEVAAGRPIGRVGATGSNVTAPHLHLEVRPGGGEPVDPATWFAEHGLAL